MKKFLKCIILLITFAVIIYTVNGIYQESKIKKGESKPQEIQIYNTIQE